MLVSAGAPPRFAWTELPSRCRNAVPTATSVNGPAAEGWVQRTLPTGHSRWLRLRLHKASLTRW